MNLGVYVTLKDDDLFIADTIKPVMDVFPQVKVIDLGSTDNSIEEIKKTNVDYIVHDLPEKKPGREFTNLKNFYSKKHDWVVWIDSDEIYPVSSLFKMKELIESGNRAHIPEILNKRVFVPYEDRRTVRCSWMLVREENGELFQANELRMNGHKAFDSRRYTYIDDWPAEVLYGNEHLKGSNKVFNDVWCWHAVMLERSTKGANDLRNRKRQAKLGMYIPEYQWIKIDKLPWRE